MNITFLHNGLSETSATITPELAARIMQFLCHVAVTGKGAKSAARKLLTDAKCKDVNIQL